MMFLKLKKVGYLRGRFVNDHVDGELGIDLDHIYLCFQVVCV